MVGGSGEQLLTSFPDHDRLFGDAYSIQIPTQSVHREVCARTLHSLSNFSSPLLFDVFVIWIDRRYPGFIPNLSYYGLSSSRVPIHFLASLRSPSLNDRFLIPSLLRTKTIISCDDDLIATPSTADEAFNFYRQHNLTNHIVGPFARSCRGNAYRFSASHYTLILTGFAFLSIDLLESYHRPEYHVAREEVTRLFNGEDILMNFITANIYHRRPIKKSISLQRYGRTGISTLPGHVQTRHHLCGFFQKTFRHIMSLRNTRND
jgi:hypothetical protein